MAEINDKLTETMAQRGYMTAAQAAERVGVALSTVYRAVERGAVQGFKAGDTGMWFVRRASLAAHYGPEVSAVCGLNDLLPGEDPNAKPLPAEHAAPKAPSRRSRAPGAKAPAKGAPSKAVARKAPPKGAARVRR